MPLEYRSIGSYNLFDFIIYCQQEIGVEKLIFPLTKLSIWFRNEASKLKNSQEVQYPTRFN